jgi:hypothetical protein
MKSRRVTPLLLAASILLTGATGVFVGSMSSAHAITSVDELTDVNQNHWAYEALRDLVEKYDVIEGYPDHTFRGNRATTRWELAAALNALIKSVGRDLARLGAEKADKADLETIARLQDEFKNELAALQARTDALESRASAIEAKNSEQDQRLSLLERTQIHGDASIGGFGDMNSQGARSVNSAPGSRDGVTDAISAVGRLRLTMDVPVREDKEDSRIGAGELHTRIIAGFGRISPNGVGAGAGNNMSSFNGYSRIASDASQYNEGLGSNRFPGLSGGTNVRSALYVEDMHYHQHFKSGIPLLTDWMVGDKKNGRFATTGDMYVGSMPWRYLFDKSPYRGNELNQFQSPAFVNTPGIAVNQNMPMIAYQWHQKLGSDSLSLDATAAAATIGVSDVMSGFNATYEGRLNYKIGDLPGNLYGGGYNVWSMGSSDPTNVANALAGTSTNRNGAATGLGTDGHKAFQGLYGGWSQEWFRGIGTTFNYMLSQGGQLNYYLNSYNQTLGASNATTANLGGNNIVVSPRTSWTGVLNIPMSAFSNFRRNDVIGVGYSLLTLRNNRIGDTPATGTRYKNALEHTAEAYYKFAVNDAISIVPSVQWINNALGIKANGSTWVVGLRTSFSF